MKLINSLTAESEYMIQNYGGICIVALSSVSDSACVPMLSSLIFRGHCENLLTCVFDVLTSVVELAAYFVTQQCLSEISSKHYTLAPNRLSELSKASLRQRSSASKQRRSFVALPDGNGNDAIPDDATVRTIFSSERKAHVIAFQRNVLPVPP
nr:hypothetical protein [Tanacetum cinerariifolium]